MLLTLAQLPRPTIVTGDPSGRVEVGIVINGSDVAVANPGVVVKMSLSSRDLRTILIAAKPATLNVVTGMWTVPFTANDTASLLSVPTDPTSALLSALTKTLDDDTGLASATLEVEVGAPYAKETFQYVVTIQKGMIV